MAVCSQAVNVTPSNEHSNLASTSLLPNVKTASVPSPISAGGVDRMVVSGAVLALDDPGVDRRLAFDEEVGLGGRHLEGVLAGQQAGVADARLAEGDGAAVERALEQGCRVVAGERERGCGVRGRRRRTGR